MPKLAKIITGLLFTLIVVGALALAWWQRDTQARLLQRQLREANEEVWEVAERGRALTTSLAAAEERARELEARAAEVSRAQQSLESEMRRALESKDVTISELQGKLTVDIVDRVLFDSGEATLKPEGVEVLRKVAAVLAQAPNRQVHVTGHTDNVPIRASPQSRYPSNWELSTARALAAVRFLTEEAGIEARRIGAVGYGEFRPIADNTTPEGRARNRRIAIVVLSEELAGLEATGVATTAAPAVVAPPVTVATNAPSAATNAPPPAAE